MHTVSLVTEYRALLILFYYFGLFLTTAGTPVIWRDPLDQIINNNVTATFECFANGSKSISIVWQKDGSKNISGNEDVKVFANGSSYSLILYRATVKDSGKYKCIAVNKDGDSAMSKEAKLISNDNAKYNKC